MTSFASLLNPFERDGVTITDPETGNSVIVDADLIQNHRLSANVTSHPVEVGSDITDHVRPEPEEYNLTGIITNTPAKVLGVVVTDPANLNATISTTLGDYNQSRAKIAYDILRGWLLNGTLLIISNARPVGEYQGEVDPVSKTAEGSMVMTSLDVPMDAARANVLEFTASFQKVETAEIATLQNPLDITVTETVTKETPKTSPAPVADKANIEKQALAIARQGT